MKGYCYSMIELIRTHTKIRCQDIAFLTIFLCLISCKEGSKTTGDNFPSIIITNSSGDDFSYQFQDSLRYFSPYPFNQGVFEHEETQKEVMLISKRLDKGKRTGIRPIAKLTLNEVNDTLRDIFIALPLDEELKIVECKDFYDFTVEQFSFKQIVEYWYSNRYGLQGTTINGWSPATVEDLNTL